MSNEQKKPTDDAVPLYDKEGYVMFLNCPECGQPCYTLPAKDPTYEYNYPHWEEGDWADCQCGATVWVEADGERAWLVLSEEA